jgi:hypothetical protein
VWRLYYDDGSTYGPDDGSWTDAPREGVLAVAEKHGERLTIHAGGDFYYLIAETTVVSTDDAAAILRSLGTPAGDEGPARGVKFGRWTTPAKMERTFARIRAEWT